MDSSSAPLGRLVRVDAREVWRHEAAHFTPWLRDNIDRLGEAIGVDVEIEGIEVGVGDFTADLRGKDLGSGRPVVIASASSSSSSRSSRTRQHLIRAER